MPASGLGRVDLEQKKPSHCPPASVALALGAKPAATGLTRPAGCSVRAQDRRCPRGRAAS